MGGYQKKESAHSADEVGRELGNNVKGITEIEREKIDSNIEMEEVSKCLMKTRNNVALGCGGFTGSNSPNIQRQSSSCNIKTGHNCTYPQRCKR